MSHQEEDRDMADYEFDIDRMEVTNKLASVYQQGNYLVGVTEKGVRFNQRIPAGKILDKVDGEYVLKDRM